MGRIGVEKVLYRHRVWGDKVMDMGPVPYPSPSTDI